MDVGSGLVAEGTAGVGPAGGRSERETDRAGGRDRRWLASANEENGVS